MRYIWGVDGAFDSTGISIFDLDTFKHLNTFNIVTSPEQGNDGFRLRYLRLEIERLKEQYPPFEVAIEGSFNHPTRYQANKDVFMALGATKDALFEYTPISYQPKTVKLVAGGHGDSTKARMKRAVLINDESALFGSVDDMYDSYCVAVTHLVKKYGMKWIVPDDDKGLKKKKPKKKNTE